MGAFQNVILRSVNDIRVFRYFIFVVFLSLSNFEVLFYTCSSCFQNGEMSFYNVFSTCVPSEMSFSEVFLTFAICSSIFFVFLKAFGKRVFFAAPQPLTHDMIVESKNVGKGQK